MILGPFHLQTAEKLRRGQSWRKLVERTWKTELKHIFFILYPYFHVVLLKKLDNLKIIEYYSDDTVYKRNLSFSFSHTTEQ